MALDVNELWGIYALLPFGSLECVLCILKRNGDRGRARFIATMRSTMKSGISARESGIWKVKLKRECTRSSTSTVTISLGQADR